MRYFSSILDNNSITRRQLIHQCTYMINWRKFWVVKPQPDCEIPFHSTCFLYYTMVWVFHAAIFVCNHTWLMMQCSTAVSRNTQSKSHTSEIYNTKGGKKVLFSLCLNNWFLTYVKTVFPFFTYSSVIVALFCSPSFSLLCYT